jgi:hypothetical protein
MMGSLRVGSPLSRSALNGIAPNIFFPTLAIFTKRDGEGGILLFAAQLPMSVVTQLKKPCQSAAVRLRTGAATLSGPTQAVGPEILK